MENKKTLWIIAAVGAFLLVVLGAALILYSPTSKTQSTFTRTSSYEKNENNNGWYNQNIELDKLKDLQKNPGENPKDMYVVTENTNIFEVPKNNNSNVIDLNNRNNAGSDSNQQNINVTVTFADKGVIPVEIVKKSDTEEAYDYKEQKTVTTVKKVEKSSPVTVKKSEPKKPVVTPNPKPITVTKYWVQVAAYSNKKGAETARAALGSNKIEADIFTYKDNKENLFYRVRVGPYTTKSEAEYWRQKITGISEFSKAQSYVTATEN